ncbi:hypothetical protein [Kitasatospora sp. NPDC101183]|uniref:hypothetical protein n=1 Tax=Kitasatospora sp. NPDC101183 TaxID=3364100 RepID=UPI0038136C9C
MESPSTEARVAVIDALSILPFPEKDGRSEVGDGWAGPGHHVAVLRQSRDFWDDIEPGVWEAAEAELAADLEAIAAVLTARWGAPRTVDLWPYLGLDDPDQEVWAPEPLAFLCNNAVTMQLWQLPSSDRWIGLTVGQGDRELPFELLAAIGDASSLPE